MNILLKLENDKNGLKMVKMIRKGQKQKIEKQWTKLVFSMKDFKTWIENIKAHEYKSNFFAINSEWFCRPRRVDWCRIWSWNYVVPLEIMRRAANQFPDWISDLWLELFTNQHGKKETTLNYPHFQLWCCLT